MILTVGGAVADVVEQSQAAAAQKKAQSDAQAAATAAQKKALQGQIDLIGQQAAITKQEMAMSAGQQTLSTLADQVIKKRNTPAPVYTLPEARTYTKIDEWNQAIDKMIRGG